jgi:BMFP domain-containing protein YqiC
MTEIDDLRDRVAELEAKLATMSQTASEIHQLASQIETKLPSDAEPHLDAIAMSELAAQLKALLDGA